MTNKVKRVFAFVEHADSLTTTPCSNQKPQNFSSSDQETINRQPCVFFPSWVAMFLQPRQLLLPRTWARAVCCPPLCRSRGAGAPLGESGALAYAQGLLWLGEGMAGGRGCESNRTSCCKNQRVFKGFGSRSLRSPFLLKLARRSVEMVTRGRFALFPWDFSLG